MKLCVHKIIDTFIYVMDKLACLLGWHLWDHKYPIDSDFDPAGPQRVCTMCGRKERKSKCACCGRDVWKRVG